VKPSESRTVHDGKLFDVTIELRSGNEREIVEHPGAVAIVAVDGADSVVLVRQLREPARRLLLELPTCGDARSERDAPTGHPSPPPTASLSPNCAHVCSEFVPKARRACKVPRA